MNDREVMFFLQSVNGIGRKTIRHLWDYFGGGEAIMNASEKELKQILKPSRLRSFLEDRERKIPQEELRKLSGKEIEYYSIFDECYPKRLLEIDDAPVGLFVRGTLPEEDILTVSVVGTRKHSYYGEKQTRQFGRMIAEKGIPIISGMARGIDGIAQNTAVEYGAKTYAVLGCGVDICYPYEHYGLYQKIPAYGGVISEYFPGTQPAAGLFPLRNRIISGLGDILLVMEAREKSGTFITVDMALEQGKEIWVLPGRVDDALSVGCNRLIAQGANILPPVNEFEAELDGLCEKYNRRSGQNEKQIRGKRESGTDGIPAIYTDDLSLLEKAVAAALDYQPLSLDAIYESLDSESRQHNSICQVSVALVKLCMKKVAKQVSAGYYIRC